MLYSLGYSCFAMEYIYTKQKLCSELKQIIFPFQSPLKPVAAHLVIMEALVLTLALKRSRVHVETDTLELTVSRVSTSIYTILI